MSSRQSPRRDVSVMDRAFSIAKVIADKQYAKDGNASEYFETLERESGKAYQELLAKGRT